MYMLNEEGISVRMISYGEAIREALIEEMAGDERVFLLGEDIALYGGAFGVTRGLLQQFGPKRVRNTPISEAAIAGAAVGAAVTGLRPVAEIMYIDFIGLAMDQIVNQGAKMRYMFGGKTSVPMVLRTTVGAGKCSAAHHSQSLEAWFFHIPGLKVVMPSTPYDAKGLLKTAIRDDNPVIFLEHKMLYNTKGEVPEDDYSVPFGVADIKRKGTDVTIIATSKMVYEAVEAARILSEREGIEAEVIDPRTLVPLDSETIVKSVMKTGRAVIVHEACQRGGIGGELAALIADSPAFDYLDAPIKRVAGENVPIPFSPPLEEYVIPDKDKIIQAVKEVLR